MDLAEGHVAAFEYLKEHARFEVFNLGTGRGVSVIELLNEFQVASGVKIKREIVGRREGDLAEYYADASKAEVTLNWKAVRSVREMCSSAWRWQCNFENKK
jgi:UDP-glucose 4-epimerase